MNIKFKTLHIEGFMSFNDADINFNNTGFTLITGVNKNTSDSAKSNGSGKSSIWEALIWCLTGETIRGTKTVENIITQTGALVSIEFSIDNDEYIITRCKNHKQYKTNLFLSINGKDNSGKGIRDTEKLVKEYMPDITASFLGSVIILGQGLPARFTSNSPSGRKEVLEKLSKSDFMIQDLKNKISNRRADLDNVLRENEDRRLSLKSKISILENQIEDVNNQLLNIENIEVYQEQLSTAMKTKEELELRDKNLRSSYDECSKSIDIYNDKLLDVNKELNSKISEIENEVKDITYKLNLDISSKESEVKYISDEIKKLDTINDTCPTCGQKIPGIIKPDTTSKKNNISILISEINELKLKLDTISNNKEIKLKNVDDNYKVIIGELKKSLAELKQQGSTLSIDINNVVSLINKENSTIVRLEEKISSVESIKQILISNMNDYTNQKNDLTNQLSNIDINIDNINQSIEVIKKFDTIVKRDFRGILLTNIINFINCKVKEYSNFIFENSKIEFILEGNNISITYQNKEYEMLSGGEKQKIDLIVQFAIRDMLCTYLDFDCNILVLDEIFDNIDSIGCSKVIDMISNKLISVGSIYIISHHADELDIPADNYIFIEKNLKGISCIK